MLYQVPAEASGVEVFTDLLLVDQSLFAPGLDKHKTLLLCVRAQRPI